MKTPLQPHTIPLTENPLENAEQRAVTGEYETIIMAADGVLGCSHLGAILYMYDVSPHFYRHVKTYIGASIGSVWSLLLSMNPCVDVFLNLAYNFLMKELPNCIDTLKCKRVPHKWGLVDSKYPYLPSYLMHVFGCKNPTFKMPHLKFGTTLVISGYNISTFQITYFDHISYPDMHILDAIKISTAIPLFFEPINFEGSLYIDPIICERVPVNYPPHALPSLTNEPHSKPPTKTLIISNHQMCPHLTPAHEMTFGHYIQCVMYSASHPGIWNANIGHLAAQSGVHTISIHLTNVNSVLTKLTRNDIDTIASNGYNETKRFFTNLA